MMSVESILAHVLGRSDGLPHAEHVAVDKLSLKVQQEPTVWAAKKFNLTVRDWISAGLYVLQVEVGEVAAVVHEIVEVSVEDLDKKADCIFVLPLRLILFSKKLYLDK